MNNEKNYVTLYNEVKNISIIEQVPVQEELIFIFLIQALANDAKILKNK